ncbi:MAG: ATP-binding protein [Thermosynechococcaceae cyanobacterium]
MLQNLVSNAIKYNLPSGWIRIDAQPQATKVLVTSTHTSQRISVGDRDRIFDRFYRGDPARNRKVEGLGLGLSLSRKIAIAHQGQPKLDQNSPSQTSLTLTLPRKSSKN